MQARWSRNGYNNIYYYYTAECRTPDTITAITQVDKLTEPLGWSGTFYVDEHQDGTRSLLWRINPIVVDVPTGKIIAQADKITYRLKTD